MRKALIALAAATIAATPVAAQAAAPLSLVPALRAGAETEDENEIRGGFILPTLAIAAIIAVLLLAKPFSSDDPSSP